MNKILISLALASIAVAANAVVIDTFDGNQFFATSNDAYAVNSTISGAIAGAGARTFGAGFSANPFNRTIAFNQFGGMVRIAAGSGVDGFAVITLTAGLNGGAPASGNTAFPNLGDQTPMNLDLSAFDTIEIDYLGNDQTSTGVAVVVYDNQFANSDVSAYFNPNVGNGTLSIPMAAIFSTVPQNSVGLIGLVVDIPNGNDIAFGEVRAVPEPASMIALGAGLLALSRRRRR
ncbi:MAG: PEP-CTERM sorting domain-containing protein [Fimbriimonadaceae bacterium]|nr:PEP-CTERM sorting domain-containing protein [Fimbriimonadaceae bacterium]